MTKKFGIILFLAVIMLSACSQPAANEQSGTTGADTANQGDTQPADQPAVTGGTESAAGEDADGFVRLPGEPSRGDSAYYITGDVCGQFTKKFMAGLLGKAITEAKPSYAELTNCQYSLGEPNQFGQAPNVLLSLSFLPIANQVKGQSAMKRTVAPDPSIPMDNYVVKQDNGLINEIYLVLGPNKFLSINRSSGNVLSEAEVLDLARKLAAKIKDYK